MSTRRATTKLRALIARGKFLELPAVYDPLAARIAQCLGFKTLYNGGFVTGGMSAISEPLLTMTEQIRVAADIAHAVDVPVVMDAGAGWGEPLHTMRTVRECIRAGIAGIHIEDQLFPKRAHYHTYVAHNIPRPEYRDKIRLACRQRDQSDRDFVIIARSDACREQGFSEAIARRLNGGASVGGRDDERRAGTAARLDRPQAVARGPGDRMAGHRFRRDARLRRSRVQTRRRHSISSVSPSTAIWPRTAPKRICGPRMRLGTLRWPGLPIFERVVHCGNRLH